MGLEQQKQSYLARSFKMIVLFAALGCIALCFAIYQINKMFENVLPKDPPATSHLQLNRPIRAELVATLNVHQK
jgi:hypothetical protein